MHVCVRVRSLRFFGVFVNGYRWWMQYIQYDYGIRSEKVYTTLRHRTTNREKKIFFYNFLLLLCFYSSVWSIQYIVWVCFARSACCSPVSGSFYSSYIYLLSSVVLLLHYCIRTYVYWYIVVRIFPDFFTFLLSLFVVVVVVVAASVAFALLLRFYFIFSFSLSLHSSVSFDCCKCFSCW